MTSFTLKRRAERAFQGFSSFQPNPCPRLLFILLAAILEGPYIISGLAGICHKYCTVVCGAEWSFKITSSRQLHCYRQNATYFFAWALGWFTGSDVWTRTNVSESFEDSFEPPGNSKGLPTAYRCFAESHLLIVELINILRMSRRVLYQCSQKS